MHERLYTTKRKSIVNALSEEIKKIDGTGEFLSDLGGNVLPNLKFFDEIEEFPAVHVAAGREVRNYLPGGVKERFLSVTIRVYVKSEDSLDDLEKLLEDLETVIEKNGRLAYQDPLGRMNMTQDITIQQIDTDEGVLAPLGVGEILLQVRY